MYRFAAAIALAFGLLTPDARGVIIECLHDEYDDEKVIRAAFELPEVVAAREKLNAFKARLLRLRERDVVALFGRPCPNRAQYFAMPVAQARTLALSGLGSSDPKQNKNHRDLHLIGGYAAIEVYYYGSIESYHGVSGDTPAVILLYYRADDTFPKLIDRNLDKRLAWEQERFRKLLDFYEERRREIFPWEVDPEEEKKLYEGEFTRDRKAKLELWKEAGKKNGWRLEIETFLGGRIRYNWYGADGRCVREATPSGTSLVPDSFIWHHPDGIHEYRGEEYQIGKGRLQWLRWQRPGGSNIRFEAFGAEGRPGSWSWGDKAGKPLRSEVDDNGDGIPDVVSTGFEDKNLRPLPLAESWAVHPDLIPPEYRIPDQPDRRVPVRKVAPPRKK